MVALQVVGLRYTIQITFTVTDVQRSGLLGGAEGEGSHWLVMKVTSTVEFMPPPTVFKVDFEEQNLVNEASGDVGDAEVKCTAVEAKLFNEAFFPGHN